MISKKTHEFKALEVKLTEDCKSPHTIYFKEHSVREHTKDKPSGKTLFAVNIPPYADEKGIANAFSAAGKVHSVLLCQKPNQTETKQTFLPETHNASFRVAYIVFSKVADLNKALALTKLQPLASNEHKVKLGVQKWKEEYNSGLWLPNKLKEKVEDFMKKYDEETKKAAEKDKEMEQEDDEGWVTVTKGGKTQSFARSEKVENKIMEKEERNKKRKELKNFYTFQIRESKMKHIVSLRQKFEEDKQKIATIKQNRRFKPF